MGDLSRFGIKRLRRPLPSGPPVVQMEDTVLRQDETSKSIEELVEESQQILSRVCREDGLESIRLDEIAHQVILRHQHLIGTNRIDVQIKADEGLPLIRGRKSQLTEVLDNLLINAILHMETRREPRILITIVQRGTFVITRVSENGVGIPHHNQDQVFDRSFRGPENGSEPGRALGLSLVREIVESYNGRVWLESEPGKGTTFSFSLPKFDPKEKALGS